MLLDCAQTFKSNRLILITFAPPSKYIKKAFFWIRKKQNSRNWIGKIRARISEYSELRCVPRFLISTLRCSTKLFQFVSIISSFSQSINHMILFSGICIHFKFKLHCISPCSFSIHQRDLQMFCFIWNFIVNSYSLF